MRLFFEWERLFFKLLVREFKKSWARGGRLTLVKCIHATKVRQASGKEAERVPQVFECIAASPDFIVHA